MILQKDNDFKNYFISLPVSVCLLSSVPGSLPGQKETVVPGQTQALPQGIFILHSWSRHSLSILGDFFLYQSNPEPNFLSYRVILGTQNFNDKTVGHPLKKIIPNHSKRKRNYDLIFNVTK